MCMSFKRFLLPMAASLCVGSAHADGDAVEPDALTLHGFGTVGVARSASDSAEFVRDLSQTKGIRNGRWSGRIDSVLGLQANWRATGEVELVGQVVSRLHYDKSRDPEVMWAFAKWEPDPRLSLRAGRIGADFMMLADSRLVGYSYLPARPSADFFGPLFFSHFDGIDASLTLPLGAGLARGKLFAGATREKAAGAPGIWDTSGSPVRGLVLDYLNGPWQFRINLASIRFADEINSYGMPARLRAAGTLLGVPQALAAAATLQAENTLTRFTSVGIVYDAGPLQVQGMLNRIRHATDVFEDSHAAYLLAGYRIGTTTPYAGISRWLSHAGHYATGLPDDDALAALNQGYAQYMAASHAHQTTYTLGTRWDFRDDMALKLQWDAVRGDADSRFPFAATQPDWNGRTDVVSAILDFVF